MRLKLRQMTHVIDSKTESFLPVSQQSDFPIQNIPFGVGRWIDGKVVCLTRIGGTVINLSILEKNNLFSDCDLNENTFGKSSLNDFLTQNKSTWRSVRAAICNLYTKGNSKYEKNSKLRNLAEWNASEILMSLPVEIGDYTDFYASKEHATNVGSMFRDPKNALLPNWSHLPVGYHGRSSTIFSTPKEINRPNGQTKKPSEDFPVFGPSQKIDFELEVGFVTGNGPRNGDSISVELAEDSIFGLVLLNDWSARDIQQWEYVPLGPFLAKNFASCISPWIITLDAFEPFRSDRPIQNNPEPLPYLQQPPNGANFNIELQVGIRPEGSEETIICESNFKHMYWSIAQQLAHHSINGCIINAGDLMGSGTISGPSKGSYGSMLEISWNGKHPIELPNGKTRSFIEDNDTIILRGSAIKDDLKIGFGECVSKIIPSKPWKRK